MSRLPLPRDLMIGLLILVPLMAGCIDAGSDAENDVQTDPTEVLRPVLDLNGTMTFVESVITPAMHFGHGLYEPTIDVSDTGVIYVSSHSTGVDIMGAPAFFSRDDGATWTQLPFAFEATVPEPLQGGTLPPSDEIFIIAGDDGQAWGVDITLATYPVNGWCDDGRAHCYHNPDAYDELRAQTSRVDLATGNDPSCSATNLNDRPWAAYANGTLLMVNNPGAGPVQVGALKVPPARYVETWNPIDGPTWNLCAGDGGGSIPGIPAIRDDQRFVVPQIQEDRLVVITGHAADVMTVEQHVVFENTHKSVSAVGNYGQAVFDQGGTLFVSAMSNTATEAGEDVGGFRVAISHDAGRTFQDRVFRFDQPVSSIYIDGNEHGPGAIINWGLLDGRGTDWYVGHIGIDDEGRPVIENGTLAVDDGPAASRHIQGAAVGPDGRSYLVFSAVSGNDQVEMLGHAGTTPLWVAVQQDGPKLPVALPVIDAVE